MVTVTISFGIKCPAGAVNQRRPVMCCDVGDLPNLDSSLSKKNVSFLNHIRMRSKSPCCIFIPKSSTEESLVGRVKLGSNKKINSFSCIRASFSDAMVYSRADVGFEKA